MQQKGHSRVQHMPMCPIPISPAPHPTSTNQQPLFFTFKLLLIIQSIPRAYNLPPSTTYNVLSLSAPPGILSSHLGISRIPQTSLAHRPLNQLIYKGDGKPHQRDAFPQIHPWRESLCRRMPTPLTPVAEGHEGPWELGGKGMPRRGEEIWKCMRRGRRGRPTYSTCL
jgi:hypothetical protein